LRLQLRDMTSQVVSAADLPELSTSSWKNHVALVAGILLGLIFLIAGAWKVLDPFKTGELLEQAKVPAGFGVLGAASLGTLELLAAFFLFTPRFRRWGGLLGGALMLFFIGWVGYYYQNLVGQECSCFPLIKRAIGPGFFVGDGVMLLLAAVAFFWAPVLNKSLRVPLIAFATLAVAATASYAWGASQHTGLEAPSPIIVDGKPQSIRDGHVFLFFYDPVCMHCNAAAKFMSGFNWGDTKVIAIPTTMPEFAAGFLHDNGLKAGTALEVEKLRKTFQFVDPPFGIALVDGREKAAFGQAQFTPPAPQADLKKLGFIQ
jgi:uncharacterized membrane protein YphA (DoxX/SURF4 family)